MNESSLSLVLLAYNEQDLLPETARACLRYLEKSPDVGELIIVDDGSTDGTGSLADALAQKHPAVRVVHHRQNRGMGAGMKSGILAAEMKYFVSLPADGQISPAEIDKLWPLLENYDFVTSIYRKRNDGLDRTILSGGLRLLLRAGLSVRVPLEGLYVFPTPAAQEWIKQSLVYSNTFLFSFELLQHAADQGLDYAVATIECRPRTSGRSKVANVRRIMRILREMAWVQTMRWKTRAGKLFNKE